MIKSSLYTIKLGKEVILKDVDFSVYQEWIREHETEYKIDRRIPSESAYLIHNTIFVVRK